MKLGMENEVVNRFAYDRNVEKLHKAGVAIATLLGCRSVAVLPEGMSQERFDWLKRWLSDPNDIFRTPGTENYIIHRSVTGPALQRIFDPLNADGNLQRSGNVPNRNRHCKGQMQELSRMDRDRAFNLGYYIGWNSSTPRWRISTAAATNPFGTDCWIWCLNRIK